MTNKAMIFDGDTLKAVEYENKSYEFIHTNVGGYIEHLFIPRFDDKGITLWVNEDGKFSDLKTTCVITYNGKITDYVNGNIVFTKTDKMGETISLTDDDIDFIKHNFSLSVKAMLQGTFLPVLSYD